MTFKQPMERKFDRVIATYFYRNRVDPWADLTTSALSEK